MLGMTGSTRHCSQTRAHMQVSMAGEASTAGLLDEGALGTPHGPLRQPVFRPHAPPPTSYPSFPPQQQPAQPAMLQHPAAGAPGQSPSSFQQLPGPHASGRHEAYQEHQQQQAAAQAPLHTGSQAGLRPLDQDQASLLADSRLPDLPLELQHRASTTNLAGAGAAGWLGSQPQSQQLRPVQEEDNGLGSYPVLFRQTSVVYSSNVEGAGAPVPGKSCFNDGHFTAGQYASVGRLQD